MHVQFALLCLLFIILIAKSYAVSETLKQRLLKDIAPCDLDQYRCNNLRCIEGYQRCDGRSDCFGGGDEKSCDVYNCGSGTFECAHRGYKKCLPYSFVCNGHKDCLDQSDETDCRGKLQRSLSASYIYRGKYLAQQWIHQLKRQGQPIQKWGLDVRRIAVALYLSKDKAFHKDNNLRGELGNELSVGLLSRMVLKKSEDISSTELASYINSFLVTCINPRNFFVLDLVKELRKRVDAQNHTIPYVMLALCNAGEKMTEKDVEKLTSFFWTAHRKFWTDMQALSLLALVCAARQPDANVDVVELSDFSVKLKARQYANGTFETLKTTALVMQALMASQTDNDEDNFNATEAIRQILLSQNGDGSFGSIIDTYSVLPVLNYKSLADISSSHCTNISIEDSWRNIYLYKTAFTGKEKELIHDLENQIGVKWTIQLSLWIGTNRTVERTLSLRVPANISFERLMEVVEKLTRFRFVFGMRDGKPYVYSIYGIQNDAEEGMNWFMFLRSKGAEEHLEPIGLAELTPKDNQHLVFWYKYGSWKE